MTQHEMDQLVRQIGDEILARLGPQAELPGPAAASSCGCGQSPRTVDGQKPAVAAGVNGNAFCGTWAPPKEGIAGLIDHTLLRPDATGAEVGQLCAEARQHRFATVCVQPSWVARAVRLLQGSKVGVCSVIGFPHGATLTPLKAAEAEQAVKLGACELDMVINVGALKSRDLDFVYSDIRSVVDVAHRAEARVKVILEMPLLSEDEKIAGCVLAKLAGADFVKTSTGFGPSGADPQDVVLMHRLVGGEMGVKAAGGIRSYRRMQEMMAAGATRIGASAGVQILREAASGAGVAAS